MNARHTNRNRQLNHSTLDLTALPYRQGTSIRGWMLLSLLCLGASAANAELVMRINGVETPSFSQVDMGDIPVDGSGQVIVTLRNESSGDIIFQETPPIQLAGGFSNQFEIIQPTLEVGNKLSPNSSTAFPIRCRPTIEFANLSANIFIYTNLSTAPIRLTLRAAGVAPDLEVDLNGDPAQSGDSFDFGEVEEGDQATITMTVNNHGGAPLDIQSLTLDGDDNFTTDGTLPNQIQPNESASIDLIYSAEGGEADTTILTLVTSDTRDDADGEFILELSASTLVEEVVVDPNENAGNNGEEDPNEVDPNNADPNNVDLNEDDLNDDLNNEDPNNAGQDINEDAGQDNADAGDIYDDEEYVDDDVTEEHDNGEEGLTDGYEEDLQPIAPIGCGFGLGFCSMLSMAGMSMMKVRRRRSYRQELTL